MPSRANYQNSSPEVFQSMLALHMATRKSSLPIELGEMPQTFLTLASARPWHGLKP